MSPGAGSIEKKEEHDLNLLEQTLLGAKIAAGLLALTYVSGYLIATTYLGTYGISADANEFLRAKYLYIGCQYWMFVTVFGVTARALGLLIHSLDQKTSEALNAHARGTTEWQTLKQRVGAKERKLQAIERSVELKTINAEVKAELERRAADHAETFWQQLRWILVVALILGAFVLEIMLVNYDNFSNIIPLHAILLLSIALYQTTFYMEYSQESYSWGLLDGRILVDWVRWIYGVWVGLAIVGLMIFRFVCSAFFPTHLLMKDLLTCLAAVCLVLILAPAAIVATLNTEDLRYFDATFPLTDEDQRRHPLFGSRKLWKAICHASVLPLRPGNPWSARLKSLVFLFGTVLYSLTALVMFFKNTFSAREWSPSLRWLAFHAPQWLVRVAHWSIQHLWFYDLWFLYYGTLCISLIVLSNILVLTYLNYRMRQDLEISIPAPWHSWILRCVAVSVLYVVSVFSFSYLIYPFIPSEKAGGRYLNNFAVTVELNHAPAGCSSKALDDVFPQSSSRKFLVLEEDTNWTYFAHIDGEQRESGGGPDNWEWWALREKSFGNAKDANNAGNCRPRVYAVNRRCIAETISVNPMEGTSPGTTSSPATPRCGPTAAIPGVK